MNQCCHEAINEAMNQCIHDSRNPWWNQGSNESMNPWVPESMKQSMNQWIKESMMQSMKQWINESMRPLWHQNGLKATLLAPKLASKPPLWHHKWPMKPHCSQPASPSEPSRLLKAWCQGFKISKLLRARGLRAPSQRNPPLESDSSATPWKP